MDKQIEPPDLDRWAQRASRRVRLEEVPDEDRARGSPSTGPCSWMLSEPAIASGRPASTGSSARTSSRSAPTGRDRRGRPAWLGDAARNRPPRRHKVAIEPAAWLDEWLRFHDRTATTGYLVEAIP